MRRLLFFLTLSALFLSPLPLLPLLAYPTPSIPPKSWELDFSFAPPRPVAVTMPDGQIRWYWFMTYKIINNTGAERLFVPEVTIATDAGDIISAGRDVPSRVFDAIREQLANPLLESPAHVVGRILQGEDHARESVIIWPDFGHDVTRLKIFIAGLSGETQTVTNPLTGQNTLLVKTLMIEFDLPGSAPTPQDQPVVFVGTQWIMR